MKLRAAGTDVQADATPGAVPHLDTSDPSLPALLDAARQSRPVRFDYVKSGSGTAQTRTLEPWGVLSWRGRWYVAGHDRDRDQPRSFRLSRIVGEVSVLGRPESFARPADLDLLAMVAGRDPEDGRLARVRVTSSGAGSLRRIAQSEDDGVLTITYNDTHWLARQIASLGSGAQVLEPPELIDAVVERLTAVVGAPW
jgi:proteasome accessory factor B